MFEAALSLHLAYILWGSLSLLLVPPVMVVVISGGSVLVNSYRGLDRLQGPSARADCFCHCGPDMVQLLVMSITGGGLSCHAAAVRC